MAKIYLADSGITITGTITNVISVATGETTYSTTANTIRSVPVADRSEHQVHVTVDENGDVILECWSCPGFRELGKFGREPTINEIYQASYNHWMGSDDD